MEKDFGGQGFDASVTGLGLGIQRCHLGALIFRADDTRRLDLRQNRVMQPKHKLRARAKGFVISQSCSWFLPSGRNVEKQFSPCAFSDYVGLGESGH